jgi:hypothetical protein
MVERLDVPFDQGKVLPIVLGVTAGAFLDGSGRDVIGGVQAFVRGKTVGNFSVTLKTLESGLSAKFMTAGAVRGTVQRLMRTRERPRGDLCGSGRVSRDDYQEEQK